MFCLFFIKQQIQIDLKTVTVKKENICKVLPRW